MGIEKSFEYKIPASPEFSKTPENTDQKNLEVSATKIEQQPIAAVAQHFLPEAEKNPVNDEKFKHVENILEEDMASLFVSLSPDEQRVFKAKGEEATIKIMEILAQPKIAIKKIVEIIKSWLALIPRLNRFYLEQLAKIKAEKIISTEGNKELL